MLEDRSWSKGLEENRPQLSVVLDSAPVAMLVLDKDGRIEMFNRECTRITGYTAGEVIGCRMADILVPPQRQDEIRELFSNFDSDVPADPTANSMADSMADGRDSEWATSSGDVRHMHLSFAFLRDDAGAVEYVVATGTEVAESPQPEFPEHDTVQQLHQLIDLCPWLVGELDCEYRFVFANDAHRDWFGLDPEGIRGKHASRIFGEEAFAILKPSYDEALFGNISCFDGSVPYSSGGTRTIHGVYVPRRDEADNVVGIYIMAIDLSEQHRLAVALEQSSRRSQAVLDAVSDGVITTTSQGIIKTFNHGAERMFGYEPEEVIGNTVGMLMPVTGNTANEEYLRHYLKTEDPSVLQTHREFVAARRDGSPFPIELSIGEFTEQDERHFTAVVRDISERNKAEVESRVRLNQLAHATRVAAMGNLASGIAHEVSQPLTAVVTNAQTCLRLVQGANAKSGQLTELIEKIVKHAGRANTVIQEMRTFLGNASDSSATDADVRELMQNTLHLMQHELSAHRVNVRLIIRETLPPVRINAVQFEQVILNLVGNAIDAMKESNGIRLLSIRASRSDGDMPGIEILLSDTGAGISETVRERLFQPFVTSKPKGMGQGLSISRSIIRAHGGDIDLASQPHQKTCFRIRLPLETVDET
jgi:two-component system sensor kinase FixL